MKVLVGLGNPGSEYKETRHNVGFLVVEAIAAAYGAVLSHSDKLQANIATARLDGERTLLVAPTTYMNLSGDSVRAVVNFYKTDIEDLLVIHDDLKLNLGVVKKSLGAKPQGHNGIKHISQCVGCTYTRLHCGIGPVPERMNVSSFVLQKFNEDERSEVSKMLKAAEKEALRFLAS